jgi:hypothetical protein
VNYDWNVPYTPCSYSKQQQKAGSASVSCARSGSAVLTGKYGVILEKRDGAIVEAVPGIGGNMQEVRFSGVAYDGAGFDAALNADDDDGFR